MLVITAPSDVLLQLAESLELPKLIGGGSHAFWEPFSKARAADFVHEADLGRTWGLSWWSSEAANRRCAGVTRQTRLFKRPS